MAQAKTETTALPPEQAPLVDLSFTLSPSKALWIVLGAGLVLRLALAFLPGFGVDVGDFHAWADQLANDGPWNFYRSDIFTDYAPGYLYLLWLIGWVNRLLHFGPGQYDYVLKLPSIAADLASAYLIYRLLEGQRSDLRVGAVALYLLFPPVLFVGAIWGQVDSVVAFLLLLSVYFIGRDRPIAGGMTYVVGFLVKPQVIAALPFLAFWGLKHYPPRVWVQVIVASAIVGLLIITPFFKGKPWHLYDQLSFAAGYYKYSSFHAYNFWAIFAYIKPDSQHFVGITHQYWGFILFGLSAAAIIYSLRRAEGMGALCLGTALCYLAFYMFITRMHERYVFPFFLPFLVACVYYNSRALWAAFAGLGFLHLANLYHAYAEFNMNGLRVERFFSWLQDPSFLGTSYSTVQVLSFFVFAVFPIALAAAFALNYRPRQPEAK